MNFLTDKDGTNRKDFEKLVLGILLIMVVGTILYMYITSHFIREEIVYLCLILAGFFVGDKALTAITDIKRGSINS